MPSFQIVRSPIFSPTSCVTCGSSSDPKGFVDLLVRSATSGFDETTAAPIHDPAGVKPTIGHLYLCVTCLHQAAHAAGCLTPQKRAEHDGALTAARAAVDRLEAELEVEKRNKVVDLTQLSELIGRQKTGQGRAKKPAGDPEPQQVA